MKLKITFELDAAERLAIGRRYGKMMTASYAESENWIRNQVAAALDDICFHKQFCDEAQIDAFEPEHNPESTR